MLESIVTCSILIAVLLLCLAAPFQDQFGDHLRRFAARLVATAIGLLLLVSLVSRVPGFTLFFLFIIAVISAYAVVELRLRLGMNSVRTRHMNYRHAGKIPLLDGSESDQVPNEEERWP